MWLLANMCSLRSATTSTVATAHKGDVQEITYNYKNLISAGGGSSALYCVLGPRLLLNSLIYHQDCESCHSCVSSEQQDQLSISVQAATLTVKAVIQLLTNLHTRHVDISMSALDHAAP